MKHSLIAILALAAACTPVGSLTSTPPPSRHSEGPPAFDAAEVRQDLEGSARAKFGAALTEQALASPTFLFAKHYVGLSPPPILQPDGSYRFPDPPMAMLVRRSEGWVTARVGAGFVPVAANKGAALDAALRDPGFWNEPVYTRPTCTDAGSSLLWLKVPGKSATLRRGACGATERTERLVWLALEA